MSAEMFFEVRNVTAESDSGKKRRRITRKKIALDDHLSSSPKRASKEDHFRGISNRGAVRYVDEDLTLDHVECAACVNL